MKALPLLMLGLGLVGLAGCSGSSDEGVVTQTCIDFLGSGSQTAGTVVAVQAAGSNCSVVAVDLIVTGVTDVFAAAFTVNFNPAVASFDGLNQSGSLLAGGGVQVDVLVDADTPGQVDVGMTRRAASGVDVAGSSKLVTLLFRIVDPGSTSLTFSDPRLTGSETPPAVKSGVQWSGGTLSVD